MPERLGPPVPRLDSGQLEQLARAAGSAELELHFDGDLDLAGRAARMARHYRGRLAREERPAGRTARP